MKGGPYLAAACCCISRYTEERCDVARAKRGTITARRGGGGVGGRL